MQTDFLQKFLDKGLLDLGEDREKFSYIQSAAQDLAKRLLENRQELVTAASVVLGGEIPDDDSIMQLCRDAIAVHWPTYGSRFPAKTVQLFRATLLQALASMTGPEADVSNSGIIYYTTCGLLPYFVTGNNDGIFREFLNDLAQSVEDEAIKTWTSPRSLDFQKIQYGDGVPSAPAIDANALKELLKNAIGPAGGTGANPNWPSSNSPDWLEFFGNGSANAIATTIRNAINGAIPKIVTQSRSDSQTTAKALYDSRSAADLYRAELLYWKEALYSPSKRDSYRHLSADGTIYWAARDLQARVPPFHPLSVEFFLRETVRSAIGEKEVKKRFTLEQFISGATYDIELKDVNSSNLDGRRLTPLQALESVAANKSDAHSAAGTQRDFISISGSERRDGGASFSQFSGSTAGRRQIDVPDNRKCALSTCIDPQEIGCNRGFEFLDQCPHWKEGGGQQASGGIPLESSGPLAGIKAQSQGEERLLHLPWTGNSLGTGDIELATACNQITMVGVVGPYNSGKTSLLTLIYLLIQKGEQASFAKFAGSWSLIAWETLGANFRWGKGEVGPTFPPHTSRGAGRRPGLLHLAIRDERNKSA